LRKPRVAFAAVTGTAILTLVFSGVASASAAPAPVDCPTAVQGLVRVQLAENRDGKAVTRLTTERDQAKIELDAATTADTTDDADVVPDDEDKAVAADQVLVNELVRLKNAQSTALAADAADAAEDTATGTPPVLPAEPTSPTDATDQAKTAAHNELTAAQAAVPTGAPTLGTARTNLAAAKAADAQEDGNGVAEDPQDGPDSRLAAAKDKLAKAQKRLDGALADKARDDQGLLTVNIALQACQGAPGVPAVPVVPVVPAPADPVATDGNPGPITIINGVAPAPQIVETHLPVTH
jgi:hypothetical protein